MCGGTQFAQRGQTVSVGLSPRVRGNQPTRQPRPGPCGSIPACAGEPSRLDIDVRSTWVYPRVCGGTSNRKSRPRAGRGLSPRVRGNLRGWPMWWIARRSIPACAGEPTAHCCTKRRSRVYPRVCGGTFRSARRPPPRLVYPRVCGGTFMRDVERDYAVGLSPRVRGNPMGSPPRPPCGRSIPACAGEPLEWRRHVFALRVYPRVCGGTSGAYSRDLIGVGLSPRVRGNLHHDVLLRAEGRSIPACAGEPRAPVRRTCANRVYPRVCGGTGSLMSRWRIVYGLSPRVRGNPFYRIRGDDGVRSIPACAGEPNLRP